ncbi:MAG: glycosyltransferase family A protein, partial [Leifsonia sp.]
MLVSVVIPARNDAPMLATCLEALARQTGLPDSVEVEIVVVDNGSSDATAQVAHDDELSVLTGTGEFYGASELVHRIGKAWYLGGMYWSMTGYLGHPPIFGSNFVMR